MTTDPNEFRARSREHVAGLLIAHGDTIAALMETVRGDITVCDADREVFDKGEGHLAYTTVVMLRSAAANAYMLAAELSDFDPRPRLDAIAPLSEDGHLHPPERPDAPQQPGSEPPEWP